MKKNIHLKLACYTMDITMSVVGNLPPILFLTFRSIYGLSYSQLGLLILLNFSTQLAVDLVFSFFSHKFSISKTLKLMPWLSVVGFALYAASPVIFPNAIFVGLMLGTIIFSASSGLAEVLLSPVIAALPADDPDREMSKLHSVYAWGVVFVIIIGTLFILAFGAHGWQYLTALLALIPLASALLFAGADIPRIETPERASGAVRFLKTPGLWFCVAAMFLGGAAECTMSQWASSYLEQSFGIPKVWGDIFGVALFAAMLGLGRSLYSQIGRNVECVLFFGTVGAAACYLTAAITTSPLLGLFACAFCGLCVSMLWPGSLVVAAERFPAGGVFIYAMMAAGGDLGASIAPQLVGVITDVAMKSRQIVSVAQNLHLDPEQFGMKLGLLVGCIFPIVAIPVYFKIWKRGAL